MLGHLVNLVYLLLTSFAAFRRFVARRGCPVEVLSDNGTNFVAANNELQELYQH